MRTKAKTMAAVAALALLAAAPAKAQQVYTLRDCLEAGLANNYSLRIARNNEQKAHNNATPANAGLLPSVDLSAGYTASSDNSDATGRADGSTTRSRNIANQSLRAGVDVNWTLFDGFGTTTAYQKLRQLERQGVTATRIEIEDFIANLTSEYYNFLQQKLRLRNYRYAVSLSKERLRIVEERYHIGSFSRLDYQQATVDFNADSAQYIKQTQLVVASRIALNEMMALPAVDAPLAISDTVIEVNGGLDYDQLLGSTLQSNADLLYASQKSALARLSYRQVLSRNYPYLKLNAGYDYAHNRYGGGSTQRSSSWGVNGGVTVGFNLWDGNRRRERRNASLETENARLESEQLELSLRANLSNLWQSYQNNLRLLNLERENLIAARENHDIAKERYLLGDLSGIEMREAQKSLLDAEERILSAEYNTKICEISLLLISGRITQYVDGE